MSILDFFNNWKQMRAVKKLSKNTIEIEVEDDPVRRPDQSKIGGRPYAPKGFVWPTFHDKEADITRPLSFFCQINLKEAARYDRDRLLPDKGMLAFFYDCEAFRWGFDPEDAGAAQVFYFENLSDCVTQEIPAELNADYVIPECSLEFEAEHSYPMFEELEYHSGIDVDWEAYDDLLEKLGVETDEEPEGHKLLGYADIIQNEMLSECERVTRGIYTGNPNYRDELTDEDEADILCKAKDWILLLQLGTIEVDNFEWMFGDCGFLYFYIRKQDLAAKRFDRTWFSVQCY